jgi:hypothetical protein
MSLTLSFEGKTYFLTIRNDIKVSLLELYFSKKMKLKNKSLKFYNESLNKWLNNDELVLKQCLSKDKLDQEVETNVKLLVIYDIDYTANIRKQKIEKKSLEELIMKVTKAKKKLTIPKIEKQATQIIKSKEFSHNLEEIIILNNNVEEHNLNSGVQMSIPDTQLTAILESMGFDENRAKLALALNNNHISRATELLLSDIFESIFNSIINYRRQVRFFN